MGRKGSRYSLEEKLKIVKLVLEENISSYRIQLIYGIQRGQVKAWVSSYQKSGLDGLKRRPFGRYSADFKLKIVHEYLQGNTSFPRLCQKYDISNSSVIYQWVNGYTSGKSLTTRSPKAMRKGRKTSFKERVEIAQWIIAHEQNYQAAVTQFNISYGQAYSWTRKFKARGEDALIDRRGKGKTEHDKLTETERLDLEVKRLKARVEHLSTENAILKKLKELERMDAAQTKSIKRFKS